MKDASLSRLDDCWNRIGVHGDRSCPELPPNIHCRNCRVFSAAARTLLDVPAAPGSAQIATEHFARPAQPETAGHTVGDDVKSVIVFRLRTEWYAIQTAACLEITDVRPIHSLPHRRDAAVLGVVNVRGGLLVCISLAVILGATARPDAAPQSRRHAAVPRLLVARGSTGAVVFPVDEVQGMERVRERDLKDVPATVAHARASYTKALIPLGDRSVGLLNEQLLFHAVGRALA